MRYNLLFTAWGKILISLWIWNMSFNRIRKLKILTIFRIANIVIQRTLSTFNRVNCVMVSVIVSMAVECVFWSRRINPRTIKLVFTASPQKRHHEGVRAKTGNQNNLSVWSDMPTHELLFQCHYPNTEPTMV